MKQAMETSAEHRVSCQDTCTITSNGPACSRVIGIARNRRTVCQVHTSNECEQRPGKLCCTSNMQKTIAAIARAAAATATSLQRSWQLILKFTVVESGAVNHSVLERQTHRLHHDRRARQRRSQERGARCQQRSPDNCTGLCGCAATGCARKRARHVQHSAGHGYWCFVGFQEINSGSRFRRSKSF